MAELESRIPKLMIEGRGLLNNLMTLAARVLPSRLCAWYVEHFIPPEGALAFAQSIPPPKVASIVDHLSTDYLVALTLEVDPVDNRPLLAAISPEAVSRIAKALVDQREFTPISRLVGYLSPAAMSRTVRMFHSAGDLLMVALEVEDKRLLSPAVAGLPTQRLAGLLVAAERGEKWHEIFDIMDAMDAGTQRQLGERLADLPARDMSGLLSAALRMDTWPKLLQIYQGLSEHAQERLAANISEQEESLHLRFMQAAHEKGQMQVLLKLVSRMPLSDQRRLVRMAARHGIRITSVL